MSDAKLVQVGDVLQGVAGSPGVITGAARILLDLSDPTRLEPGDILIAPSTDPSWTPLFLSAGGVITNIGAVGTHAVIVSRELGIPCVPSIADATVAHPRRGHHHPRRQPRHRHHRRSAVSKPS